MSSMYYHTSSLANSAADNSYRYAGASPNNYVCFGSDASTCSSDNLYRIIGVFGSEVKLIKSTSYGNYAWSTSGNTWARSSLKSTLNSTFLNSFSTVWQNKIISYTWYVEGYNQKEVPPKSFYDAESSGTTWNGKIGLMYISDYGYAASNNYWTTTLWDYDLATNSNWLYLGTEEWPITRDKFFQYDTFYIRDNGDINWQGGFNQGYTYAVRPCFYLTSSTTYVSGSGTSSDPIRIN